jgi:hypothetical protein
MKSKDMTVCNAYAHPHGSEKWPKINEFGHSKGAAT